ncbi:MAG: helix-turn-helix domain-containing protein [Pseudomonadota bacterium]
MTSIYETDDAGASGIAQLLFSNAKPHPIDKFVGEKVKHYRKRKKLTQTELGNELGLTFQQIQKYEKGSNRIGASRIFLLAKLLEVPVYKFFEGLELELNVANIPGMAEPSSPYEESPTRLEERNELLTAFNSVSDEATRKRIIDLVKVIGQEVSG